MYVNIYIICLLIHTILKTQLPLSRLSELLACVVQRSIWKIIKRRWNVVQEKGLPRRSGYFWNQDAIRVFTLWPKVLYYSACILNSYLVRAKLYPLERTVALWKCKNFLWHPRDWFVYCSNEQINFKINHKFDYNGRCFICLTTCNRCLKQYVGQTVDEFRQWITQESLKREKTQVIHGF